MKAAQLERPIPLVHVQMIVPVTDNTAQTTGDPYLSWKECANTVWLNSHRMIWFRDFYVPAEADRKKWDCSPIFAPDHLLARMPSTWVAVMELDILRDEGLAYAERLRKVGVPVTHKLYKKAPHQILAMDGRLGFALRRTALTQATISTCLWSRRVSSGSSIDKFLLIASDSVLAVGRELVADATRNLAEVFAALEL